jgi:hypothetical protein
MNSVLTSRSSAANSVSMPSELPPKEASVTDVLRPVAPQERIRALDLLRGWAMFGVLWSNLNDVYAKHASVTTLDHALWWTQQWLLESRFYTLLILLFGIGFGIQLIRADTRATDLLLDDVVNRRRSVEPDSGVETAQKMNRVQCDAAAFLASAANRVTPSQLGNALR